MALEARQIQIGYGEHVVVEGMDITVERGKITTLIGPNGSGKSTVLKAITRLIRFQQGTVLLEGKESVR
jgi:iron complex transport system ATP-binding protein